MKRDVKAAWAELSVEAANKLCAGEDAHWQSVALVTDALEETERSLREARAKLRKWEEWEPLRLEGLKLLDEHYRSNDPYVDDYPSARHAGAEHRKTCKTCALYGDYLRRLNTP